MPTSYWTQGNLGLNCPAPIQALVTNLGSVNTALKSVMMMIQSLAKVAEVYYKAVINPFMALAGKLVTTIENFIKDMFSSGIYQLVVAPYEGYNSYTKMNDDGYYILTPGQAITTASNSFNDLGDKNRPVYSANATVAALGFLLTAYTPSGLQALMDQFNNVLEVNDFVDISAQAKRNARKGITGGTRVYKNTPPDWTSVSLRSISILADVEKEMIKAVELINGFVLYSANAALKQLLNSLKFKVRQFQGIISRLTNLIVKFTKALTSQGLYILSIPPTTGGVNAIKTKMKNATLSASTNQYTVFVLYVAGGASIVGLTSLMSIISI